jgi:hypothetical protein
MYKIVVLALVTLCISYAVASPVAFEMRAFDPNTGYDGTVCSVSANQFQGQGNVYFTVGASTNGVFGAPPQGLQFNSGKLPKFIRI